MSELRHQAFQPFLKLDSPIIDDRGLASLPHYRLLLTLWQRSGAASSPITGAAYLRVEPNGTISVVSVTTGQVLGTLTLSGPGLPEQALSPTTSPFTYKATGSGFIVANEGRLEIQRSGAWYVVSPAGGSVTLRQNDSIRVTWFSSTVPQVVWFPDV
jgi:hypothetical protein